MDRRYRHREVEEAREEESEMIGGINSVVRDEER